MYHSILAFRGINKSTTHIRHRLLETVRYAVRDRHAAAVIRGNATPPNMNRSLINVQAINRRIIVPGFAGAIIGRSGIPRNRNGTTGTGGNYYVRFLFSVTSKIARRRRRQRREGEGEASRSDQWSVLSSPRPSYIQTL